ncbi:MAG: lecithin retinol acyltransferase family protein [Gammaproteobacteria bacterium]|nr:lecithin retinol acyltransferase family protein [Gammaproteobacteria bacterium]
MSKPSSTHHFGDHLKIKRRFYYHHGIYIGDNKVIHYAPPPGKDVADGIGWRQIFGVDSEVNTIHVTDLKYFLHDEETEPVVVNYSRDISYPPLKVVARAYSRLGENGYNLWGNNCEHFVQWCKLVDPLEYGIRFWDSILENTWLGIEKGIKRLQPFPENVVNKTISPEQKEQLRDTPTKTSYDEFIDHASSLYFNLVQDRNRYPFGRSFRHTNQIYNHSVPVSLLPEMGNNVLFLYEGNFLPGRHTKDWYITERALVNLAKDEIINFHDVSDVSHHLGQVMITLINGNRHFVKSRYADAASLGLFLKAAISGTELDAAQIRVTGWSKFKELFRQILAPGKNDLPD